MGSVPNQTTKISAQSKAFSVSIIGGGIGGLTLAIGLLKHPHIDVQVYESAPSFGEIGAGVAFGPNAQKALELIGNGVDIALEKHKTGNLWASHANYFAEHRVGKGEHEGEIITCQKNATGMQSVHRAHFLDTLIQLVPAQRAHFCKRLVKIEDNSKRGGKVVMHFKDGTKEETDAFIGADGIHSAVRLSLLGEDHPAAKPVFTGAVAYRGLVPLDVAVEKLGAEHAQNSTMLCGPGKAIMSYPIDFGKIFNIAIMDFEHPKWESEQSIEPCKYNDFARLFEGWSAAAQGVIELLDKPDLAVWKLSDHEPAPFFSKGRVTMLGDGAHATTPFQGQGAGQAVEDALVLEALLGRTKTVEHISNAFTAYDEIRRPRSQRVVTTSREAGQLLAMKQEGIGSDIEKMRQALDTRMHWIWHRSQSAQVEAAVQLFEESL